MLLHRLLGGQDRPRGAIGDLRAVAGGDLAPRPLEGGPQGGELIDAGIGPHAVVLGIDLAGAVEGGLHFVGKPVFGLGLGEPLVALNRIFIGLAPRDIEKLRQHLGGLAHVQLDHGIGEAALEPDDRLEEEARTQPRKQRQPRPEIARAEHAQEPLNGLAVIDEWRMAQRDPLIHAPAH